MPAVHDAFAGGAEKSRCEEDGRDRGVHIEVFPSVNAARADELAGKIVLVIDVLRATSSIIAALESGASSVVPAETAEHARSLKREGDMLAGERFGKPIPEFDFGNSPLEYTPDNVGGRRVILTTTNGTRAIFKAQKAVSVIAACLRNAEAAARAALELRRDVAILCSGTQDVFSLEDGLCAGLLVEELVRRAGKPLGMNAFAVAMRSAYLHWEGRLEEAIARSANGRRLEKHGFGDDVSYCAQPNRSALVPAQCEGAMTVRPLSVHGTF